MLATTNAAPSTDQAAIGLCPSMMSPKALLGMAGMLPTMMRPQQNEPWSWQLLAHLQGAFVHPPHANIPVTIATRLRTGAICDEHYDETFTILVTREWPVHLRERDVDVWWPMLSPSHRLLRTRRGPDGERMPWLLFVARYWAELTALPRSVQDSYVIRLGELLRRYPSVTLFSTEPSKGRPEAEIRSQRRVLHSWLLGG